MRTSVFVSAYLAAVLTASSSHAEVELPPPPIAEMHASPGAALSRCDGFGGVSRSGDGILRAARSVDTIGRARPSFQHSIAYCDRALLVLEEFPDYWLRRVSVLQSRAIYRLIENDAEGALGDLQRAEESVRVPTDPGYLRTLALNGMVIRAMALIQSGAREEGDALAIEASQRRPYSGALLRSALMVVGSSSARERAQGLLDQLARLDPNLRGFDQRYRNGEPLPEPDLHEFYMLMLEPEGDEPHRHGSSFTPSVEALRQYRACVQQTDTGFQIQDGVFRLCEFTYRDTSAVASERIVFRAAREVVRMRGTRFLIRSRSDVKHSATSQYSRSLFHSGYEIDATFVIVGADADCAHCLDPNQIVSDLSADYGTTGSRRR